MRPHELMSDEDEHEHEYEDPLQWMPIANLFVLNLSPPLEQMTIR